MSGWIQAAMQQNNIFCSILGEKPVDSLQLMIEASDSASGKGKLLDEEITGNAFVFILAG